MKLMSALIAVGMVVGGMVALELNAADDEKPNIKKVMQTCMKGGLCKKVADGKASEEEKTQLLSMFKSLATLKPPKGEEESWKAKTKVLVDGAQAAVDGKENAGTLLKNAANCMACHKSHKPS